MNGAVLPFSPLFTVKIQMALLMPRRFLFSSHFASPIVLKHSCCTNLSPVPSDISSIDPSIIVFAKGDPSYVLSSSLIPKRTSAGTLSCALYIPLVGEPTRPFRLGRTVLRCFGSPKGNCSRTAIHDGTAYRQSGSMKPSFHFARCRGVPGRQIRSSNAEEHIRGTVNSRTQPEDQDYD